MRSSGQVGVRYGLSVLRGTTGLALAVAIAIPLAAAPLAAGSVTAAPEQEESGCTRKPGVFEPGGTPEQSEPIALTPDQPAETINFGGGRGWKFIDVVLRAARPLPNDFKVSQLDLEVLRRPTRRGDTTTTVATKPLSFTEPRLNPRRDVITFSICVNGDGLDAGHYVGAVAAEGPGGIGPANMTLNLNAKNGVLFWTTFSISFILVFFLLVWRGATTTQAEKAKDVADAVSKAQPSGALVEVPADVKRDAQAVVKKHARWDLKRDVLEDPFFWVSTGLAAAFAVAAAATIYAQNTGWGADPVVDAFAVISAVIAAAGFRSLIATAASK
jgi:hypothetical protein